MNTMLSIDYVDRKTEHTFHLPISVFKKPKNSKEYSKLEKILDKLIDEVKDNSKHPLAIAMQIIGENLEQYDNEHYPEIGFNINEIDVVKYLMRSHNLNQSDLADIFGGQANVSKFLNAKRPLSKLQIAGLKKKFGISADFFVSRVSAASVKTISKSFEHIKDLVAKSHETGKAGRDKPAPDRKKSPL